MTYMGTKDRLSGAISEAITASAPSGIVVDLFCGVGSIARSVSKTHHVWCNDVQLFASQLAKAYFTFRSRPSDINDVIPALERHYRENRAALWSRLRSHVLKEDRILRAESAQAQCRFDDELRDLFFDPSFFKMLSDRKTDTRTFPYCLFAIQYSGTYFGIQQAIELDSIRYAIDRLFIEEQISSNTREWMLVALCTCLLRCATTTGHFAQYLTPKTSTIRRFVAIRGRSIYKAWREDLQKCVPYGSAMWRSGNVATCSDALEVLDLSVSIKKNISVIYADPPYTKDQYSRYYHVLETVLLYDYPEVSGKARYRDGRFVSAFCLSNAVKGAFEDLLDMANECGANIVISYPTAGVFKESRTMIPNLLRERYKTVRVTRIDHLHSTFGASKGKDRTSVSEFLYQGVGAR